MTTLYHNPHRAQSQSGDDRPCCGHSIVQSTGETPRDETLTTET